MKEVVSLLLDDSLVSQRRFLGECDLVHDLRDFGRSSRYWCRKKELLGLVFPFDVENKIIFYGSCDFHHITYAFLSRLKDPHTLVIIDKHTEASRVFGDWIYCGSWIYDAIRLKQIERVCVVGVCADIHTLFLHEFLNPLMFALFVDIDLLLSKTRMYPMIDVNKRFVPLSVGRKLDKLIAPRFDNVDDLLSSLLGDLRGRRVYVSIDKDVLTADYSRTNWGNGVFSLDSLVKVVDGISSVNEVTGIDVCGDLSFDKPRGLLRGLSFWERNLWRKPEKGFGALNENTNLRLLKEFRRL